jgi:endoribonuclease Dicer
MTNFCKLLPEDRKLFGREENLEEIVQGQAKKRIYTIATTGAKLTYPHARDVLERFASSLVRKTSIYRVSSEANKNQQYENELAPRVTYVIVSENDMFSCEIILPEKSPIRGIIGCPEARKSVAKQSAAFDACLLLRRNNLLDEHFNSVYHRRLPTMRNAKLAITSKRTDQYNIRIKPSIWLNQQGVIPTRLYAIVICLLPSAPLSRAHGVMMLLTREKLSSFPAFPIFLDDDVETKVKCMCIERSMEVTPFKLELFTAFTLAVFHDVFNKTYAPVAEQFPYWLAPVKPTYATPKSDVGFDFFDVIDWETLDYVQKNPEIFWSEDMEPESLLNRFLYDDWNGKYRYFPIAIDTNLRPSDPPPYYAPHRKWDQDIMSWSLSLSKNSRARFFNRCFWGQPVVQADLIGLRRNFLDKASDDEKAESARCAICPQALNISPVGLYFLGFALSYANLDSSLYQWSPLAWHSRQ